MRSRFGSFQIGLPKNSFALVCLSYSEADYFVMQL
jgi:hypothetical protein